MAICRLQKPSKPSKAICRFIQQVAFFYFPFDLQVQRFTIQEHLRNSFDIFEYFSDIFCVCVALLISRIFYLRFCDNINESFTHVSTWHFFEHFLKYNFHTYRFATSGSVLETFVSFIFLSETHQCWNLRRIYGGQEPSSNRVIVPTRSSTYFF